ncbi:MAG: lipoyl(octanoyl) transferase LipB [Candidatus Alcyoniella australis]|nr:lipoyl(octanoyl) transferase LipB [Candidatus Alcyoniella australis]
MTEAAALRAFYLGRVSYGRAFELQNKLRQQIIAGGPETILLLEHDPVITLGYSQQCDESLLRTPQQLTERGIELVQSDRGGKTTYHGPGQLVGYLLLDLGRRRLALKNLVGFIESSLIDLLLSYSIRSGIREGMHGVWIGDEKIGFIGLNVQHGVTTHGFALNLNNELRPFDYFAPCGIEDAKVTSLKRITGEELCLPEVSRRFIDYFGETSGISAQIESADALELP